MPWIKFGLATVAVALSAVLAGEAVAAPRYVDRHHRRHVAGDIYVRKNRPIDPRPGFETVGALNHYATDAMPTSFTALGAPFSAHLGNFDLLPDRFNVPGPQEPLFQF